MRETGDGELTETVIRLIGVELNASREDVRRAGSLRRDLKMDSVAAASLLFAIEEEYGIELELERVESIDTVEGIVAVVARSRASRRGDHPV